MLLPCTFRLKRTQLQPKASDEHLSAVNTLKHLIHILMSEISYHFGNQAATNSMYHYESYFQNVDNYFKNKTHIIKNVNMKFAKANNLFMIDFLIITTFI